MSAARAAALAAGLHLAAAAPASPLGAMTWERRVLVVMAPAANDTRVAETRRRLDARACEVAERDLSVALAPARGDGRIDGRPLLRDDVAAIRDRFRASDHDFLVVLVGKDGGEKLRLAEPPAPDEVFALIDGMPMRRAEMRARGPACRG